MSLFGRKSESVTDSALDGTFYGARPIDGESLVVLPQGFKEMYDAFIAATEAYKTRKVTRTAYLKRLQQLRMRDVTGQTWTMGAATHGWYRKTASGQWTAASAPTLPSVDLLPDWDSINEPTAVIVTEQAEQEQVWPDGIAPTDIVDLFAEPESVVMEPRSGTPLADERLLAVEAEKFLADEFGPVPRYDINDVEDDEDSTDWTWEDGQK